MRRWVLVAWLLSPPIACRAQQVRYESGPPVTYRREILKAPEDSPGVAPLLSASQPNGCVIGASGNYKNADITIVIANDEIPRLLPLVLQFLREHHYEDVVVIIRKGRVVGALDLEFNRYIRDDHGIHRFELPLGAVVSQAKDWKLPRLIGAIIRGRADGGLTFHGQKITKNYIPIFRTIKPNDVVAGSMERHWDGLLMLLVMGGMFLLAPGVVVAALIRSRKPGTPKAAPPVVTLGEAQAKYEKRKLSQVFALLPIFMVALMRPSSFDSLQDWMPSGGSQWFQLAPLLMAALLGGVILPIQIKRNWKTGSRLKAISPLFLVVPLLIVMGQLYARMMGIYLPAWVPTAALISIGAGLVGFVVILALGVSKAKDDWTPLPAGDPDYESAMEMARMANTRVKKVLLMPSEKMNAVATLGNRVGITKGAREKLTVEERRILLAHEIGHVRGKHVTYNLAGAIAILAVYESLRFYGREHGWYSVNSPLYGVMNSAMVPIFVTPLLLSPFKRRAEYSADRFALEETRSFEKVASVLAKVHLDNEAPIRLKAAHELSATHPSLENRLKSLRARALELGMIVPDGTIERIINETRLGTSPSQ
ncbi:MAG: M48 family metalloprotease [Armatimonadetes bacterium]|nr:M48 family metalloprotease [Armatimonadota bacterium]